MRSFRLTPPSAGSMRGQKRGDPFSLSDHSKLLILSGLVWQNMLGIMGLTKLSGLVPLNSQYVYPRQFHKKLLLLCFLFFVVQQLRTGLPPAAHRFSSEEDYDFTLPIDTFTNGDGFVFPICERRRHEQDDEVTVVAVPVRGYVFSSW